MQTVLKAFCQLPEDNADVLRLLNCLQTFLLQVQAITIAACEIQQRINRLLGRSDAEVDFDAKFIDIHNLLQGEEARKVPFILDELESVLNITILITPVTLEIYSKDPEKIHFAPEK